MTCLTSDLMGVTGEVPGVSGDMTGEVMCMYWVALDHSSIQEHELYIVHPNIGPYHMLQTFLLYYPYIQALGNSREHLFGFWF